MSINPVMIIIMTSKIMSRQKIENEHIRKIMKSGNSYVVSLPMEIFHKLKWQEKQKVLVNLKSRTIHIKDWKD